MEVNKSKYQLEYYRNYGICDQCGAVILLLDKALSYNGDEQQNLQSFLGRNAIFWNFPNSDERQLFEKNGGLIKQEEKSDYMSPYHATEYVGSKSINGQFCCTECRDKWKAEKRADDMKITIFFQGLREYAYKVAPEPCSNPSGIVVFDLETTGLNSRDNEILQISAIDGDGNVLINEYVRPELVEAWPEEEWIHGITPGMVAHCKTLRELTGKIKGVFASGKTWIAYNADFDLSFLYSIGIEVDPDTNVEDVMLDFAEIYGEYNKKYGNYKWQTLETAAEYYGYEYQAHNSLEDVRATWYIRNKIRQTKEELDMLSEEILSDR